MKKIVSVILLFVFAFYIFTGCASERAYVKSGLSEIKCAEKLGQIAMSFNVYGKISGAIVPAEHKDVSMLFLTDQKSGNAYMEYLEAKKNLDGLAPVTSAVLLVTIVSFIMSLGVMGGNTGSGIWLNVLGVSLCVSTLLTGLGLVDSIDAGVKLDEAISLYNASCRF